MKNNYTKYLLVLLMALQTAFAISQEKPNLPHNLTETEKALVSEYQFTSPRISPPPSGPVRAAAEWEEVEYLLVILVLSIFFLKKRKKDVVQSSQGLTIAPEADAEIIL